MEPIRLAYYSDVLCVWAYIAQIRLQELLTQFPDQVAIDYHFVPVFGNAREKLTQRWQDKGGLAGYNQHIQAVGQKYQHITVHPEVWLATVPTSSTSCHLFLYAVQLLVKNGIILQSEQQFEQVIWRCREQFFTQLADVSDRRVQFAIAEELGLPVAAIQAQIDSGAAYALLSQDFEAVREQHITVSPTLIFNEGRQRLNGNVGYRVIEANVRELFHNPPNEQSWC